MSLIAFVKSIKNESIDIERKINILGKYKSYFVNYQKSK